MHTLTQQLLLLFPELKERLAPGDEGLPYVMMGHLLDWVREELAKGNLYAVSPRVVAFTDWCEDQPSPEEGGEDITDIYTTGFFEKLFVSAETRPLVTQLTTRERLKQEDVRDYYVARVGQEAYDATLAEFDLTPPSIRDLWSRTKPWRYPWSRFYTWLGGFAVLMLVLFSVFMVPEIRGYHAYVGLLNGEPVTLKKLIIRRPERWVLTDEASLKYITAYLRKKTEQQGHEDDYEAAGTLVFGPLKRVSYTDVILSRESDYMLLLHDDFGHEYYYRIPIRENTPQELRGMVYALVELARVTEAQQPPPPPEVEEADPRMKLPGQAK